MEIRQNHGNPLLLLPGRYRLTTWRRNQIVRLTGNSDFPMGIQSDGEDSYWLCGWHNGEEISVIQSCLRRV